MSTPIVEAQGLTRSFGKVQALNGLDLVAESGQVVAVLGPNGRQDDVRRPVATLVRPDGGELRVAGIDALRRPEQVRRVIGLAGQYAAIEPAMTGRENVVMVARLYGQTRRQARANTAVVLDQLGLTDAADARSAPTPAACGAGSTWAPASSAPASCCSTSRPPVSTPQPQRAVGGHPLDGAGRHRRAAHHPVPRRGRPAGTAGRDRRQDRVIADGTPGELKSRAGRDVVEIRVHRPEDLSVVAESVGRIGVEAGRRRHPAGHHPGGRRSGVIAEAIRALDALDVEVDDIGLRRPTLDEVFLTLTGSPIDAGEPESTDESTDQSTDEGEHFAQAA